MGSGTSVAHSPPQKPSNYSQEKWDKILRLFDHIDSDSNFVIDTGDTKTLTALARQVLDEDMGQKQTEYQYLTTELRKTEEAKRKQFEQELKAWTAKSTAEIQMKCNEIMNMKSYTDTQACAYFVKKAGDGKHLTFYKFFEFMKNRV